jgi:hypothetical protein
MPQFLFGAIALIAQRFLRESPMNGYRQMANVIHFNTIGSTFQDELRGGFAFHAVDQKDEGDVLLHLAQKVEYLRFSPVCAGVLGHNEVKQLRTESSGELFGCHNYI